MRLPLAGILLVLGGCTTVQAVAPTVPNTLSRRVEEQALPPDPASEPLPAALPKGEWVEPLEAGSCLGSDGKALSDAPRPCPVRSGISVSEERAARDAMYRIRYKELRLNYEADRGVWGAQRELYEGRLNDANTALKEAQPGWWDRHKGEIGVIGGMLLGTAATIGIVYGVAPAMK